MEKFVNNEILKEIDFLVEDIKKTSIYQRYQAIKDKMQQNEELMNLIKSYKKLQQELVQYEYNKQEAKVIELEKELQYQKEILMKNPLYSEYIFIQEELNESFQLIKDTLTDYFDQKLNE